MWIVQQREYGFSRGTETTSSFFYFLEAWSFQGSSWSCHYSLYNTGISLFIQLLFSSYEWFCRLLFACGCGFHIWLTWGNLLPCCFDWWVWMGLLWTSLQLLCPQLVGDETFLEIFSFYWENIGLFISIFIPRFIPNGARNHFNIIFLSSISFPPKRYSGLWEKMNLIASAKHTSMVEQRIQTLISNILSTLMCWHQHSLFRVE